MIEAMSLSCGRRRFQQAWSPAADHTVRNGLATRASWGVQPACPCRVTLCTCFPLPTSYTVEEVCAALNVRLEVAEDKLRLIADWCAAYPLEMFPKPNTKKARALLGDTLFTQLSAYSMRHVCEGIAKIAAQADGRKKVNGEREER